MTENDLLRARSGTVKSKNRLVTVLYELMRDHLPAGTLETIIRDLDGPNCDEFIFTNGWLASYAQDLAERIEK